MTINNKIQALLTSRKSRKNTISCSIFTSKCSEIFVLVNQSPDSASLSSLVNTSSSVSSCSVEEKQILLKLKVQNLEAIQSVENEMNAVQTALGGNI
jgi:hypothetical protein